MVRRSTPQTKRDKLAFPIRVRFIVPGTGLGLRVNDLYAFLRGEVGSSGFAIHASPALASDGMGVYLRDIETAKRMIAAFPEFELADGTHRAAYCSLAAWIAREK